MRGYSFFGTGRSKNPPIFEDFSHFRRTWDNIPISLRSSGQKIEEPSIFHLRSRRTKNRPSSIFDLWPKIVEPPYSIFGSEEWSEDRTEDGRCDFFQDVLFEDGSSSIFRLRRQSNFSIFDILGQKNEEPFHLSFFRLEERITRSFSSSSDPPSANLHHMRAAFLRFGSSARYSTLTIGPKIEIGPLRTLFGLPAPKIEDAR